MYYYSYRAFYFFISVRLVNLNAKIVKIERNAKQIAILFSFIFFTVVGGFAANISTVPSASPLGLPSFSLACGWRFPRQHLLHYYYFFYAIFSLYLRYIIKTTMGIPGGKTLNQEKNRQQYHRRRHQICCHEHLLGAASSPASLKSSLELKGLFRS